MDIAQDIANQTDHEEKWRQLADLSLINYDMPLAEECMRRGQDFSGLLLLYSSTGNAQGLEMLSELACKQQPVLVIITIVAIRYESLWLLLFGWGESLF